MKTQAISAALILFAIVFAANATADDDPASDGLTERMIAAPLPEGGEIRALVSQRTGTSPDNVALLFPGSPGEIHLHVIDGALVYDLKGNFLIRARRWLNTDRVMTAVVDCPTERWNGCNAVYRRSAQDGKDITALIDALQKELGPKTFTIVGTSYGTVSTANLARMLDGRVAGAVHTSSFGGTSKHTFETGMVNFDWSQAKVPQLFVHHRDDPCNATPYGDLKGRIGDQPLITVADGHDFSGDACKAFSPHGFRGREKEVMTAIAAWITDRKVTPLDTNE